MGERAERVLLIGYGNPGRQDDGLGPAFAEAVARLKRPSVTVDANYQLQVEDAEAIAAHDVVIFADADVSCVPPFRFEALAPASEITFSTHSIGPASVLAMAHDLFGGTTKGYLLGIRGYAFNEFEERLSAGAEANLAAAVEFSASVLRDRRFDSFLTESVVASAYADGV